MDRRSFLKNTAAVAAAVPFTALIARTSAHQDPHPACSTRPHGGLWTAVRHTRRVDRAAAADAAGGIQVRELRLDRRSARQLTADAWCARRHGGVCGRAWSRAARAQSRDRTRASRSAAPRTIAGAAGGTTTLEFDTHKGELLSGARQPERHHPQLRRRADAVGHVADVRRNQRVHDACRTATSSKCPPTAWAIPTPLARHGPLLARGGRRRSGDRLRLRNRGRRRQLGLLSIRPDASGDLARRRRAVHAEGRRASTWRTSARAIANGTTFDVEWVPIEHDRITQRRRRPATSSGRRAARGRRHVCAARRLLVRQRPQDLHRVDQRRHRPGPDLGVRPAPKNASRCCSSHRAPDVLNAPDNITVSPRGGLVLCEDGGGRGVHARADRRRRDLPVRAEQRRPATASATELSATSADRSGQARATARMASGCSRTSRARGSRSRSPDRGSLARSNELTCSVVARTDVNHSSRVGV